MDLTVPIIIPEENRHCGYRSSNGAMPLIPPTDINITKDRDLCNFCISPHIYRPPLVVHVVDLHARLAIVTVHSPI